MRPTFSKGFRRLPIAGAVAALCGVLSLPAGASSHREAPFIAGQPRVDATDFYMFNSYESGRSTFVTLIANYLPLQDPYGGPNFYALDQNALYEIHIDNNGDAKEDITFQFRFKNTLANSGNGVALGVGSPSKPVAIPLIQAGLPVSTVRSPLLNLAESFTLDIVRSSDVDKTRRNGTKKSVTNASGGSATFDKPVDNIGTKTIPDYAKYADLHIYTINIPDCATPGQLFVGQRKDPFKVNLGAIFDLVNAPLAVITDPSKIDAGVDSLIEKNVTTLALEVPKACLTAGTETVIGGWTTASMRQGRLLNGKPGKGFGTTGVNGGAWTQVSRLGMPLVNEVVIGLADKDLFNASKPMNDGQFIDYVTNPTLPKLLEVAFGLDGKIQPTNPGRNDLVTTFLTGIKGVNQPAGVKASEMLRLNTAIPAVPFDAQNRLGIVGNILAGGTDNAGYPNGRRPKDDVVDISLVAMAGGLCMANGDTDKLGFGAACKPSAVPLGATAFNLHDAVDQAKIVLRTTFPYLNTPLPGAK